MSNMKVSSAAVKSKLLVLVPLRASVVLVDLDLGPVRRRNRCRYFLTGVRTERQE